jgi:GT2 family glycosyltransferase
MKRPDTRPFTTGKRPQQPAATGAITGLFGNTLLGWAYNRSDPEQRLIVEIYIDDAFVAVTRADKEQPIDVEGDGFHGLWVQLPMVFLKTAKKVSARIANQGAWLTGSIALPQASTNAHQVTQPAQSHVYYGGGLRINGWAFDPAQSGKELVLRAREGDQIVATTTADKPHPALVYSKDPDHGFEFDLPWPLADGQPHTIHVETETGEPLAGSPITICVRPEGLAQLLHRHLPTTMDAPTRGLLIALAEQQARRFPGSCGFEQYESWFNLFQQPGPMMRPKGQVTVLLLNEPTDTRQDRERSLQSISQQRLPQNQITVVTADASALADTLRPHLQQDTLLVPLRVGDRLAPHALDTLLETFNSHPEAAWGTADCDQDTDAGGRTNPWLKPAWDETLFQSLDLVTPGGAFRSETVLKALPQLTANSGWGDLLNAIVVQQPSNVLHLPRVLYHRSALASCIPERRTPQWPTPKRWPSVSLIVPTRDQLHYLQPCIDGLLDDTDYPDLEIIVVNNDSHEPETLSYLKNIQQRGVKVLDYPKAFNYAAINNWAVGQATGTVVGLINNDIKVIEPNWLKTMVTQLSRPNVGAVGAKLLWPNGMVQHGGVVVGINQLAAHSGNKCYKDDAGYLGVNQVAREQSAVTAACLLMTKADFEALKGFDADQFPVAFNDVDLCLRLRQTGKRIVWTPDAMLIHAESASRGKEDSPSKAQRAHREQSNFIRQWATLIVTDPHYHPALSQDFANGPYAALACPPPPLTPRVSKPAPEGQIGVR